MQEVRNKDANTIPVGLLPELHPLSVANDKHFTLFQQKLFYQCYEFLLKPLIEVAVKHLRYLGVIRIL